MRRLSRRALGAICVISMLLASSARAAEAAPTPSPTDATSTGTQPREAEDADIDPAKRDELLGAGWQRSGDRMWTTSGDATGFHLLVAEARTGYAWRTAATLKQPGVEADQWIGNACVTGSGRRALVVYAPRTFTNKPTLF